MTEYILRNDPMGSDLFWNIHPERINPRQDADLVETVWIWFTSFQNFVLNWQTWESNSWSKCTTDLVFLLEWRTCMGRTSAKLWILLLLHCEIWKISFNNYRDTIKVCSGFLVHSPVCTWIYMCFYCFLLLPDVSLWSLSDALQNNRWLLFSALYTFLSRRSPASWRDLCLEQCCINHLSRR